MLLDAGEQADARYRANPVDRCYYCKTNLYARIREATPDAIASGTNRDDLDDFRPGLRAAAERDVVHPYVEAGIDKADVYALAASLGLDDLERLPAQPCLASRVETGIAIAPDDLAFIDAVETRLAARLGPRSGAALPGDARGHRDRARVRAGRGGGGARPRHRRRCLPRGRPRVRRRASLRARRGVSAQGRRWLNSVSTGQRAGRTGTSEAVLCEPKSAAQIDAIVAHAAELGRRLLLTRLGPRKFGRLAASARDALDYDDATRTAILGGLPADASPSAASRSSAAARRILPVAGEAARTLAFAGEAGDARRRRRRRRAVAAHGAARRDPPPSRGHRRGGHGGRALQRARRASFRAR